MKMSTKIGLIAMIAALFFLGFAGKSNAIDVYDSEGRLIDDPKIQQYCIRFVPDFLPTVESTTCIHHKFSMEIKGCTLGPEEMRECSNFVFIDRIVIED